MKHICHLTSVHPDNDIRIFKKECISLQRAGFRVTLLAINGESRTEDGVEVIGIPCKFKNRWERARKATKLLKEAALKINADAFHIHDPEMMDAAIQIKQIKRVKIVADIHEYTAGQIRQKHYIPKILQPILGKLYEVYEKSKLKKFDGLIYAVPFENTHLFQLHENTQVVYNFPILQEFKQAPFFDKNKLIYVGGISPDRGLYSMLDLLQANNELKLVMAGNFFSSSYETVLKNHPDFHRIDFRGIVDRKGVAEIYIKGGIGLLLFANKPNLALSMPIKMFEYMAAGLPIICSDFDHWKSIIDKYNCGIYVNPNNRKEVLNAIQKLQNQSTLAVQMGQNGRKAAIEHFNWAQEAEKLVGFYHKLLKV